MSTEPSVIDALVAQSQTERRRTGPPCKIGRFLDGLDDPGARAEAIVIFRHPHILPLVAIRHLGADNITEGMVTHHRRGKCDGCRLDGTFPA
jgi:hypothetical protein